tara:strand:+ start:105220 stop:105327 length:108 start_codon:yes stop_codon:yes gene_type:complete
MFSITIASAKIQNQVQKKISTKSVEILFTIRKLYG